MKTLLFLFITSYSLCQSEISLSISIPQNSGLAFVDYEQYKISNDTLFVIYQDFRINLNDSLSTSNYDLDTTSFYVLDKSKLTELRTVLTEIDSLEDDVAYGCLFNMGWPRFFMSASIDGREMKAYIANCYRKNVFRLVDFLNENYPDGNIIAYDKAELIATEQKCNEYKFGGGDND